MLPSSEGPLTVQHRSLLALTFLVSCTTGVEDGLFSSSPTVSSTNATTFPAESSDGGPVASSDESGPVDPTATPNTTADEGTGGSSSGNADGPPAESSGDPTNDPTNDPTIVPSDSSSTEPVDPSGNEESSSGVDPTGVASDECCDGLATPGCGDAALEACTCGVDTYCCSDAWDVICVAEATDACGAACPGAGFGNCCTAHGGLGCDNAEFEACVCGVDDYCCTGEWDSLCVDTAYYDCGIPC